MTLLAALLVLLAGAAVGATSIGGVLVVPVLTGLAAIKPPRAIAASTLAFAFCGVAAALLARQAERRAATTRMAAAGVPAGFAGAAIAPELADPLPRLLPLHAAALAGAALGAATLQWLPPSAVQWVVAGLAIGSGTWALIGAAAGHDTRPAPSATLLTALGLVVGCGSAWSGTGGPVLLLPLLTLLGWPPRLAVGVAQQIQLPVAVAATAVNAALGRLDLLLGIGLGLLVLAGWFAGRRAARQIPAAPLRRLLAVALILVGLWYAAAGSS